MNEALSPFERVPLTSQWENGQLLGLLGRWLSKTVSPQGTCIVCRLAFRVLTCDPQWAITTPQTLPELVVMSSAIEHDVVEAVTVPGLAVPAQALTKAAQPRAIDIAVSLSLGLDATCAAFLEQLESIVPGCLASATGMVERQSAICQLQVALPWGTGWGSDIWSCSRNSMTLRVSWDGVEAPDVTPTRRIPTNQSRLMSSMLSTR